MVERNVSKLELRNVVNDKSRDEWLYLIRQTNDKTTDINTAAFGGAYIER